MESEGARKRGGESGARERVQEWRERKGQEWIERGERGDEWSERERKGREGAKKRWGESGVGERERGVIGERGGREWREREGRE